MNLFLELNNLMVKYRFKPNKKNGQHFMTNQNTIDRVVEIAELKKDETVLEIGPGTGFLTRALKENNKVIAIEKDEKMIELLEEELGDSITLISEDYLKAKIPKYDKCVSFPPYSLSKKIIFKLIKEKPAKCVLLFQFEFAEKLTALPGFRQYTAVTVLAQYHFDIKIKGIVHAKNFYPKPKSDSAIIELNIAKRKQKAKNDESFTYFIEEIFRHKNKTLSNALQNSAKFLPGKTGISKNYVEKARVFDGKEKVMQLSVEQLIKLYNALCD